jgi:hypothetical protein
MTSPYSHCPERPLPGWEPRWYRIASGEYAGMLHINGWKLSAIKGDGRCMGGSGWVSYASCPICFAMVLTGDTAYGDLSWAHERWHARTDFPVPDELLNDDDRAAGYTLPSQAPVGQ